MDERRMDTYAAHTSNEEARSTVIPGVRAQKRGDFLFPRQQSSRIPVRVAYSVRYFPSFSLYCLVRGSDIVSPIDYAMIHDYRIVRCVRQRLISSLVFSFYISLPPSSQSNFASTVNQLQDRELRENLLFDRIQCFNKILSRPILTEKRRGTVRDLSFVRISSLDF